MLAEMREKRVKSQGSREEALLLIKTKLLNGYRKDITESVKNKITIPGRFTKEEFYEFKVNPDKLDTLNTFELCWFVSALEEVNPINYRTKAYFTDSEIIQSKIYTRKKSEFEDYLTLEYCGQMAPGQYLCQATVQQLGILKSSGYLHVIPEAQRESNIIMIGNEPIRTIHVNYNRVREIAAALADQKYFYNDIRLNLIKDDECGFVLDAENKKLVLPKDGIVIIPDGNHRCIACESAIDQYKELASSFYNNKFPILFTNYPVTIVRNVIAQEWNREPVKKTHIDAMELTNANRIIEKIIEKSDIDADKSYASQIVTSRSEIAYGHGIILKSLLADSIIDNYKTESGEYNSLVNRNKLINWLIDFYNQVVYYLKEDYDNFKSVRSKKWSVSPEAWVGFTYLSKVLYERNDWKEILKNVLEGIDFSKEKFPVKTKKNKGIIKDMNNYFEGMVKDAGKKFL